MSEEFGEASLNRIVLSVFDQGQYFGQQGSPKLDSEFQTWDSDTNYQDRGMTCPVNVLRTLRVVFASNPILAAVMGDL